MQEKTGFGNYVEEPLKQYLREASEQVSVSSDEDRAVLVENVLEELIGKEMKVATDAECSRLLEVFLAECSDALALGVLERLALRETLFTVASNPFGSRVLEKLLPRLQAAVASDDEKALQVLDDIVLLVKEDLQDYIDNKFATFFARNLLLLLLGELAAAGDAAPKKKGAKAAAATAERTGLETKLAVIEARAAGQEAPPAAPAEAAAAHVRSFARALCGTQFDDETVMTLQRSSFASPYLQLLLRATRFDKKLYQALFLRMLGVTLAAGEGARAGMKRLDVKKLTSQMKHKASSHMMEAVISACPPELYDALWAAMQPSFAALCLNPVANYVAQALVAAAPDARFTTEAFHAVKGNLTDVMLNQRSGVAVVLFAACAAYNVCCAECCEAVQNAFSDRALQELATLDMVEDLATLAEQRSGKTRLSTSGCILLRIIFSMPQTACRALTDATLALPDDQLFAIARDGAGARAIEALLKGSAPKQLKTKLLLKLKENLGTMCTMPAPSRLVEAFFVWAELPEKRLIVEQIAPRHKDLQNSKHGLGLYQLANVEAWLRSPDEWQQRMKSSEKMAASFKKLFGDEAAGKKKKRKRAERDGRESGDASKPAPEPEPAPETEPIEPSKPAKRAKKAAAAAAAAEAEAADEADAAPEPSAAMETEANNGDQPQEEMSNRKKRRIARAERAAALYAERQAAKLARAAAGEAAGSEGADSDSAAAPAAGEPAAKKAKPSAAPAAEGAAPNGSAPATPVAVKKVKPLDKYELKKLKRLQRQKEGMSAEAFAIHEKRRAEKAAAREALLARRKARKAARQQEKRDRLKGMSDEDRAKLTKKERRKLKAQAKRDLKKGRVPKSKGASADGEPGADAPKSPKSKKVKVKKVKVKKAKAPKAKKRGGRNE